MLNRVVIFIVICVLAGCAHNTKQRTYRDMIDSDYFAAERLSPQFLKELKKECPSMISDLENLNKQLVKEKASGNEKAGEKTSEKIKWLNGWITMAGCEYGEQMVPEPVTHQEKAISHEPVPSEVKIDKTPGQQPAERKDTTLSVTPLTFDECFKKCKELTTRTNEECFDACIRR